MDKDRFEQRLDDVATRWQQQRYSGPMPSFEPRRQRHPLAWSGALATAAAAIFLLWPGEPDWPDELRPVMRGSPFAATAPAPPQAGMAFRLPSAPARPTCFTATEDCDQPAG